MTSPALSFGNGRFGRLAAMRGSHHPSAPLAHSASQRSEACSVWKCPEVPNTAKSQSRWGEREIQVLRISKNLGLKILLTICRKQASRTPTNRPHGAADLYAPVGNNSYIQVPDLERNEWNMSEGRTCAIPRRVKSSVTPSIGWPEHLHCVARTSHNPPWPILIHHVLRGVPEVEDRSTNSGGFSRAKSNINDARLPRPFFKR